MSQQKQTQHRESRYVRVARIAYRLSLQAMPTYSHPKSPHHFTLPQLAACVLMTFYLNLSYRDMEEWLLASSEVREVLSLERVPDHSTLSRTYKKMKVKDFDKMKHLLLSELGIEGSESMIAVDTTGFDLTGASAYYRSRRGNIYRQYIKGGYSVGTQSQFILGWLTGRGPTNDTGYLAGLRRQACKYGQYRGEGKGRRREWLLLADSGFDSRRVEQMDIVPPMRRGAGPGGRGPTRVVAPARQARADMVSQARLDGVYGQRWKVETVNSVVKRRFGSAIRSRKRSLQRREPIIKAMVYNIHV
ncbi:MAG: transposase [Chloroflexota bacterium]